jgi:hypothetical protein
MAAEHDVRGFQPRPVAGVIHIRDEMNINRDRNGQMLRASDKRTHESGVREHSEICPLRQAMEGLDWIVDCVYRGEVGKSHPVTVGGDEDNSKGSRASVDDAVAG